MPIFSSIGVISHRVTFHGLLYFTKPVGASYGDPQLWRTDGTAAGTQLVLDAQVGIQWVIAIGDSLLFQTPQKTYRSDGSPAGTHEIPRMPHFSTQPIVCAGNAFVPSSPTLWQIDASLNARPLATFQGGAVWLGCAAGRIYLLSNTLSAGYHLWTSDGSPDGTALVGTVGVFQLLGTAENRVIFKTADGKVASSDGTAAGTMLVKDVRPPDPGTVPFPVSLDNRLLFLADDAALVRELWVSDGTAAGTFIVLGGASSTIDALAVVRGRAFFSASDPQHGRELWRSDGTPEGTSLFADVDPGPSSSSPIQFTAAGDTLFFVATDANGRRLHALPIDWRTISIDDVRVPETAGTATLTVSLDAPAKQSVSASWSTTDGSAHGSLVFSPGETRKTISLTVDRHPEPGGNHFIDVRLSGITGAVPVKSFGTVVIEDVDAAADLAVSLVRSKDRRLDAYDIVVKNLGPSTAPGVTLRSASTTGIGDVTLPPLRPGESATSTTHFDELLGVTASSPLPDPNPTNNSASIRLSVDSTPSTSTLRLALIPAALTAGMRARLLIDSINAGTVQLTSSDPSVIAVPASLTTSAEITEIELAALSPGSTTITASTQGTSVSMTIAVESGATYRWPAAMTFTIENGSLVFGTPRRLTATLRGIAYDTLTRPTGSVAFSENGNVLANVVVTAAVDGTLTASTVVDSLLPGDHTLAASYSGDAKFLPESKSLPPLHIFPAPEATFTATMHLLDDDRALVTIAATPLARVLPTGTITVTRTPFRTVVAENVPLVAGIAVVTVGAPFPTSVTVEYSGDAVYHATVRTVPLLPATRRHAAH